MTKIKVIVGEHGNFYSYKNGRLITNFNPKTHHLATPDETSEYYARVRHGSQNTRIPKNLSKTTENRAARIERLKVKAAAINGRISRESELLEKAKHRLANH
jgi:hypothetical protein